jgi:beta-N-acetylhexosaminidase
VIESDTLESLGQHFVIGLRPGVDLDPRDARLLTDVRPAGVVVFRGNFIADAAYEVWHARFARLVAAVRRAIGRDDVVIGIDHEGGTVLRPPEPITPFAFAQSWGDQAERVGRAMGVELASLGVNVNFAPVADVDSNALNPVIGARAFSDSPEAVARACVLFCRGLQAGGVLPCAKHFPGHGDSAADSHDGSLTSCGGVSDLPESWSPTISECARSQPGSSGRARVRRF